MTTDSRHQIKLPMSFDSAVDLLVSLLLFLPPLSSAVIGSFLMVEGMLDQAWIFFLAAAFILLVTAALVAPCRYTLLEDAVSVRFGLFCYQIPYSRIQKVELSRSWRSGPALSLRRVSIQTLQKEYLVSPKDRDHFFQLLSELAELGKGDEDTSQR